MEYINQREGFLCVLVKFSLPGLRGKSKSMTWSTAGMSSPLAAMSVHTWVMVMVMVIK